MKVCVITIEYPPIESGVGVACRRIVKNLSKKVEMHVLTFGSAKDGFLVNKGRSIESVIEDGVHIHRISPYSGTLTSVPPQEIQNLCYFLKKLDEKYEFDIFHAFNLSGSGYVAAYMAKVLGKKSLVSVRGNDIGRDAYDPDKLFGIKWIIDNSDHVTFVASDLLDQADRITPCRNKSHVILNSLDPFEFFYKEIKLKLDGFVVCFSGVVRRKKGFSYLLDAFSRFSKKHKSTLFIVGELMQEEKMTYLRMIEEKGLLENVLITGRVSHNVILNYISLADVFVLPALSEGCSNSLLEAMYCKKPCITTDVGAAKEIITHNKNGIFIELHSSDAIFRALNRLKAGKKRRTEIGDAAKKTVQKNHDSLTESKKWLALYKKCVKNHPSKMGGMIGKTLPVIPLLGDGS